MKASFDINCFIYNDPTLRLVENRLITKEENEYEFISSYSDYIFKICTIYSLNTKKKIYDDIDKHSNNHILLRSTSNILNNHHEITVNQNCYYKIYSVSSTLLDLCNIYNDNNGNNNHNNNHDHNNNNNNNNNSNNDKTFSISVELICDGVFRLPLCRILRIETCKNFLPNNSKNVDKDIFTNYFNSCYYNASIIHDLIKGAVFMKYNNSIVLPPPTVDENNIHIQLFFTCISIQDDNCDMDNPFLMAINDATTIFDQRLWLPSWSFNIYSNFNDHSEVPTESKIKDSELILMSQCDANMVIIPIDKENNNVLTDCNIIHSCLGSDGIGMRNPDACSTIKGALECLTNTNTNSNLNNISVDSNNNNNDNVHVLLVGSKGTGKTSLVISMIEDYNRNLQSCMSCLHIVCVGINLNNTSSNLNVLNNLDNNNNNNTNKNVLIYDDFSYSSSKSNNNKYEYFIIQLLGAIKLAQKITPCVLLIDEIDKIYMYCHENNMDNIFNDLISLQMNKQILLFATCIDPHVLPKFLISLFANIIQLSQPNSNQHFYIAKELLQKYDKLNKLPCNFYKIINNHSQNIVIHRNTFNLIDKCVSLMKGKSYISSVLKAINLIHEEMTILLENYLLSSNQNKYYNINNDIYNNNNNKFIKFNNNTNIIGHEHVRNELHELLEWPCLYPNLMKTLDIDGSCGILLYGPPGTGKTLIAKEQATKLNRHFLSIHLTDIVHAEIGTGEQKLYEIFNEAERLAPSLIFIDEFQAIFSSRNTTTTNNNGNNNKTNTNNGTGILLSSALASCMDRVAIWNSIHENTTNTFISVMAATNEPWSIDPGFLRNGRFDRHFYIGPLDIISIKSMLIKGFKISSNNDAIDKLCEECFKCTGAEIEYLIHRSWSVLNLRDKKMKKDKINKGNQTIEKFEKEKKLEKNDIIEVALEIVKDMDINYQKQLLRYKEYDHWSAIHK